MTKRAKISNHLQVVDLPNTMAVEVPLPLVGAFANIESSFFCARGREPQRPDSLWRRGGCGDERSDLRENGQAVRDLVSGKWTPF